MMTIKAIQTSYKGYKFRSRLEARWAVFFDALGYQWEYEPEGFTLSDGRRYLPDFRITSPQGYTAWYEVKHCEAVDDGKMGVMSSDFYEKFQEYDCKTGCYNAPTTSFRVLSGDPYSYFGVDHLKFNHGVCPRCGGITDDQIIGAGKEYYICWLCDLNTASQNDPEIGFSGFECTSWKGCVEIERDDHTDHLVAVISACCKARSARFEHGECPR